MEVKIRLFKPLQCLHLDNEILIIRFAVLINLERASRVSINRLCDAENKFKKTFGALEITKLNEKRHTALQFSDCTW